jgi:uncharacterized protein (DUF1778 family)
MSEKTTKRREFITFRVTPEEKEVIHKLAQDQNLDASTYVRIKAMNPAQLKAS